MLSLLQGLPHCSVKAGLVPRASLKSHPGRNPVGQSFPTIPVMLEKKKNPGHPQAKNSLLRYCPNGLAGVPIQAPEEWVALLSSFHPLAQIPLTGRAVSPGIILKEDSSPAS